MIPALRIPFLNRSTILIAIALLAIGAWWVLGPVDPEVVVAGQKVPGAMEMENGTLHWTTVQDGLAHSLVEGKIVDLPPPPPARAPSAGLVSSHGSDIAVEDDGAVHWTVAPVQYGPAADGAVVGALPDGSVRTWASKLAYTTAIAAAGDQIFWIADGKLSRTARSPISPVVLSTMHVYALAADSSAVYWHESGGSAFIMAADLDGSKPRVVTQSVSVGLIDATHPDHLVAMSYNEIIRIPKAGGTWTVVASAGLSSFPWRSDSFIRMVVDGEDVFATTSTGRIVHIDASGQTRELARGKGPYDIAVDGDWVYWSEPESGRIRRIARD